MKRRGKIKTEFTNYTFSNESTRQVFERFLRVKEAENLSSKSLATYSFHVEMFFRSLGEAADQPAWQTCTLARYNDYILYLKSLNTMKDVSIASYCRSLRAWFYWMMDNKCIAEFAVKIPKFQKTIPQTYTDEELAVLLVKPKKGCSYADYESWVFINIAIATGLRLSSILNLKVSDIVFSESIINVNYTKNKQGMKLVINDELLSILRTYIKLLSLDGDSYLFTTGEGTKLANRTMEDFITRYESKHGIKKAKQIHAFRHTFARNFYLQTHDMYRLKELMGHTMISTTEHYLGTLGLDTSTKIEYNPQAKFAQNIEKKVKKSRRGKME